MEFRHYSVMLGECMDALKPESGGIFVDCTAGGGGHSLEIAKRLPEGSRLICLDREDDLGIDKINGALWDLGVSSHQLDDAERGFSYMQDAPLDMRMDSSSPLSAKEVVNGYSEKDLARIISDYGEERFASKIAYNIVKARSEKEIETTSELVKLIE